MKHTTLLVALLLTLTVVSAVPDATLQRYDPAPAQPGDVLTLYLSVHNNNQDTTMRNVEVELIPSASIIPEGETNTRIGSITPRSSALVTMNARILAEAPVGEALLRVRVRSDNGEWQERTMRIPTTTQESGLHIVHIERTPAVAVPGTEQTITLTVQNSASSRVREATVQLELTGTPFSPAQGTSRNTIGALSARQSTQTTFMLATAPQASANTYQVPFTMSFLDENGVRQTISDTIGIEVHTPIRTEAYVDNVQWQGEELELSIRVVNKGLSEIKFAQAIIEEQASYTLRAQDKRAYLGNIDTDDWETLRIRLQTSAEEIQVPFSYQFLDAFNNEHEVQTTLRVTVPAQQQSSSAGLWIVLVLLIAGFAFYRYKKKQGKKK